MPTRRDLANAIRALSMDAVQKANSGHPGAPMGMADIAEVLWRDVLKFNPGNPTWLNRDRFVLSNGHASMLLYSVLHLTGYPLSMDEIKNFRQFGSKTPGHPERELHLGIETTTGPLGQGFANAVGMALAERSMAATFNRPGHDIIDHHTYVFVGDGCMMEGISHEAASLAGMQQLGKLIAIYDDNGISIDGKVVGWFDDDTAHRFEAYGWHVIPHVDGHSSEAVAAALSAARAVTDKPSFICAKTIIGFGAPKQGTQTMHGEAMGVDDIAIARKTLNWPSPPFEIPADISAAWDRREKGAAAERNWNDKFTAYKREFPDLAAELQRRMAGDLPSGFDQLIKNFASGVQAEGKALATRQSSQAALNAIGPCMPELLGGSADLTPSNGTWRKDSVTLMPMTAPAGNYIHYGVREFGMSAIMNGIAVHGGLIPYGGTFLTFSDYARNAVRMACLMRIRVIFVYTHDSIGLGEDGPTHQPIEHLASLRVIPHMDLWRPCDGVETAVAWGVAADNRDGPTLLVLTRQACTHQAREPAQVANITRGGYVLIEAAGGAPEAIVIATGSEVGIAAEAVRTLNGKGRKIRLVSMPSTNRFDAQDEAYKESVLPARVTRRVAVEAGVRSDWWRYVGLKGQVVGIDHFGASAPAKVLFPQFGFTPEKVIEAVEKTAG
ncbi:MAG TPA: transketolase [Steroidobacteraceae bacterium]|jgi:transketolase